MDHPMSWLWLRLQALLGEENAAALKQEYLQKERAYQKEWRDAQKRKREEDNRRVREERMREKEALRE